MIAGKGSNDQDAAAQVGATLARLGLTDTALGTVGATLVRAAPADFDARALPFIDLAADGERGAPIQSDLVMRGELGHGGMGIVRIAEQRSLRREVAVKTATTNAAPTRNALVREARIMGGLEHPNVVPVHALGVDGEGAPVLVMKRVEGVSWRALLDDANHEAWRPLLAGHGDVLRAHLEILSQVSRALAFAHDRGVVHRDLKPENVMIGSFGEVYLLDWGVALRISDRAKEPHCIVGTPGYLAPEMARGDPQLVDARTDVFLLGASLYEVLTGQMPNAAPTPLAALVISISGARRAPPSSAPSELALLVEAAMRLDRDARIASAETFREGLARYLASRDADLLVREGTSARERAERIVAADGAAAPEAYRALIEARFALMSAARLRSEDPQIRAGLDACLGQLVGREIALASPLGARTHLGEMRNPPARLVAEVERLEHDLATERTAAEAGLRARAEADSSFSAPAIAVVVLTLSLLSILFWLWRRPPGDFLFATPRWVALAESGALVAAALILFIARRRLLANLAARQLTAFFLVWGWAPLPFALAQAARGDRAYDLVLALVLGMALGAAGSIALLPELWPTVPVHALALVAAIARPGRADLVWVALMILNGAVIVRALRARGVRTKLEQAAAHRRRS